MPMQNTSTKVRDNLAGNFLLPLLALRRDQFGNMLNYVGTRLTQYNQLVVEVMDQGLCDWQCQQVPSFEYTFRHPTYNTEMFVYRMDVWKPDITKFRNGQYSQFSPEAKARIRLGAGNWDANGVFFTYSSSKTKFMYLLALEKAPELKQYWEKLLDTHLPDDMELLDRPSEHDFINL